MFEDLCPVWQGEYNDILHLKESIPGNCHFEFQKMYFVFFAGKYSGMSLKFVESEIFQKSFHQVPQKYVSYDVISPAKQNPSGSNV